MSGPAARLNQTVRAWIPFVIDGKVHRLPFQIITRVDGPCDIIRIGDNTLWFERGEFDGTEHRVGKDVGPDDPLVVAVTEALTASHAGAGKGAPVRDFYFEADEIAGIEERMQAGVPSASA